jgi:hypothetical protein
MSTSRISSGQTSYIDAREFRSFARALKLARPALRRETIRNLRAAGDLIAKDAKAIAGEHSESIPPTIKTQVRGMRVGVQAGGKGNARAAFNAPYGTLTSNKALRQAEEGIALAGLYELGNKGESNKSSAAAERGVFRHPVFGHADRWVDQERHPFLVPAAKKNEAKTQALVREALDKAMEVVVVAK